MIQDAVPNFKGQVQSLAFLLQAVHCPDALYIVLKTKRADPVQRPLPRMPKGCMSQVMSQGYGFHQFLVKPKRLCYGARVLGDLQGMGEPGPVMIPLRGQEDLRLIL